MIKEFATLLAAAITGSRTEQQAIVVELKRLNDTFERAFPKPIERQAPTEEPLLGDDPYTLAMAADAESVLQQELGRTPTTEEILERMRVWKERRDPVAPRRDPIDVG